MSTVDILSSAVTMTEPYVDVRIHDGKIVRHHVIEYSRVPRRILEPLLRIHTSSYNVLDNARQNRYRRDPFDQQVVTDTKIVSSPFSVATLEAFREFILHVGADSWPEYDDWLDPECQHIMVKPVEENDEEENNDDNDKEDRDASIKPSPYPDDVKALRNATVAGDRVIYRPRQHSEFMVREFPPGVGGYPFPHVITVEWNTEDDHELAERIDDLEDLEDEAKLAEEVEKKRERDRACATPDTQAEADNGDNEEPSPKLPRIHIEEEDDTSKPCQDTETAIQVVKGLDNLLNGIEKDIHMTA